ncbi:MAG TPA: [FeFe] hydrogenase H-cluster radical SAM maturase HydE [Deltaproteobacteria bacterium]|nr:[FeFe] hydrogenase H-cluster radical SAM maturase HydE [Deltaproteobacteria bacterium]HOI08411.1 [FeFe] hydrogenase H-cluster radical SAM maturase HydE [Deltaproteobacteria bacterium]
MTREEILFLLTRNESDEVEAILSAADKVRRSFCGEYVHVRALVEFSNCCRRNCNYCGLRRGNWGLVRYRMPVDEIVELAVDLDARGLKTIVLQSGEDPFYTADILTGLVQDIKRRTDMAVTLCVGERPKEDYRKFLDAGADRYLLRHEAANRDLYASLHPDSDYDERMECLRYLRDIGFQVGAGCMVGVPGQTVEHLADDIEFIRQFQPDMVGIGPFIAHPDTPFAGYPNGGLDMTLKMVALARIVTRDALIPATTAIGSIREDGRELALQAGADVVMPNYTPLKHRVHYEIYPNKRCITEDPVNCHSCMRMRILSVERTVAEDAGHSRKRHLQ